MEPLVERSAEEEAVPPTIRIRSFAGLILLSVSMLNRDAWTVYHLKEYAEQQGWPAKEEWELCAGPERLGNAHKLVDLVSTVAAGAALELTAVRSVARKEVVVLLPAGSVVLDLETGGAAQIAPELERSRLSECAACLRGHHHVAGRVKAAALGPDFRNGGSTFNAANMDGRGSTMESPSVSPRWTLKDRAVCLDPAPHESIANVTPQAISWSVGCAVVSEVGYLAVTQWDPMQKGSKPTVHIWNFRSGALARQHVLDLEPWPKLYDAVQCEAFVQGDLLVVVVQVEMGRKSRTTAFSWPGALAASGPKVVQIPDNYSYENSALGSGLLAFAGVSRPKGVLGAVDLYPLGPDGLAGPPSCTYRRRGCDFRAVALAEHHCAMTMQCQGRLCVELFLLRDKRVCELVWQQPLGPSEAGPWPQIFLSRPGGPTLEAIVKALREASSKAPAAVEDGHP